MVIRTIQQKVLIGDEISVYLKTGEEVKGVLVEIGREHITIQNTDGEDTLFEDVIGRFKALKSRKKERALDGERIFTNAQANDSSAVGEIVESSPYSIPPQADFYLKRREEKSSQQESEDVFVEPLVSLANPPSIEVVKKFAEIKARVSSEMRGKEIKALPPDFSMPVSISSISYSVAKTTLQGEWDKLRGKYQYALKVKDFSRLNQLISGCEIFVDKYIDEQPKLATAIKFNIGCLHFKLGNFSQAIENFEEQASGSLSNKAFYNLAASALAKKDEAKACYALKMYLCSQTFRENLDAFYKYSDLAIKTGAIASFSTLLKAAITENREEDILLVLDCVVFLLDDYGKEERAYQLVEYIVDEKLDLNQISEFIDEVLPNLEIKPTSAYVIQEQVLLEAQKKGEEKREYLKNKREFEGVIQSAQGFARKQLYSNAISEIRRALKIFSEDSYAKELERDYLEKYREQSMPKGASTYARAKRAQLKKDDFEIVEGLFRRAIEENDNAETAVKDLASLYSQKNCDEEAIKLLKKHRNKASNRSSIDNLLVGVYQHAKKYDEAISLLTEIQEREPRHREVVILKQIAACQFKIRDYDKAEKTILHILRIDKSEQIAQNWLEGVKQAKQNGYSASLEEMFVVKDTLVDFGADISKFFEFYIDSCAYTGVKEEKIQNRSFTEEDVRKLKGLIEGAGRSRPSLRAQYYLSSAKLLIDFNSEDKDNIRYNLQNYAANMGDSSLIENKPQDVTLAYYLEAFLIAPKWRSRQSRSELYLEERLSRSIMLLYSTARDELVSTSRLPSPEKCMQEAVDKKRGGALIEWLLKISLNRPVAEFLLNLIHSDKRLSKDIQSLCCQLLNEEIEQSNFGLAELTALWEKARETVRQKEQDFSSNVMYLKVLCEKWGSFSDQIKRVQSLAADSNTLDRRRLGDTVKILGLMLDYSHQPDYSERERLFEYTKKELDELTEEIENSPTKSSLELIHPYLLSLKQALKNDFQVVQEIAEPEELGVKLSIDSYIPDSNSKIDCQMTIENQVGKSPASTIKIQLEPSPEKEYCFEQKDINVIEALPGGKVITCEIPLTVTDKAKQSDIFSLYYKLSYTTRTGKQIVTDIKTLPASLSRETDFEEIRNPYAAWAESGEVTDPEMFFGRDQFIDNLIKGIESSPGSRSLVIYGQKRAGKSSILYHLKSRLPKSVIPVKFSIGEIMGNASEANFLFLVMRGIEDALEDLAEAGKPHISIKSPRVHELERNPHALFHDYMSTLRRSMKKIKEYKDSKIILLIDEFTYIYGEFSSERLRLFMQFWKALLQKGYFSCVLVGQDTMRQFMSDFPNEFQVAQSERVSYLAPEDARKLIIDPIFVPSTKQSRYTGGAVERLMDLTAGSPFYIQIVCNRLVNYMNRKRLVKVTDAHIERVKEELIRGNNSLTQDKFDNLISAYDDSTNIVSKDDAMSVLRSISLGSKSQHWCEQSTISADCSVPIENVLEDLVSREVLEKQTSSFAFLFRIKVGLFKEWLLVNQ